MIDSSTKSSFLLVTPLPVQAQILYCIAILLISKILCMNGLFNDPEEVLQIFFSFLHASIVRHGTSQTLCACWSSEAWYWPDSSWLCGTGQTLCMLMALATLCGCSWHSVDALARHLLWSTALARHSAMTNHAIMIACSWQCRKTWLSSIECVLVDYSTQRYEHWYVNRERHIPCVCDWWKGWKYSLTGYRDMWLLGMVHFLLDIFFCIYV